MKCYRVHIILGLLYGISMLYLEALAKNEIYFSTQNDFAVQHSWLVVPDSNNALKIFLLNYDIPYSKNCTDCYLQLHLDHAPDEGKISLSSPLCNDESSTSSRSLPMTWITRDIVIVDYFCKGNVTFTQHRSPDRSLTFLLSYANSVPSNYTCKPVLWDEDLKTWNFSAIIQTRGDTPIICSWEIHAQAESNSLEVYFQHFNLMSTMHCEYDYIEIDDSIETFAGSGKICVYDINRPLHIITKGSVVNITLYVSNEIDSNIHDVHGIAGTVKEINNDLERKVEGIVFLSGMEGRINCNSTSPPSFVLGNYVNKYIWDIRVRPGFQILISWNTDVFNAFGASLFLSVLDKLSNRKQLIDLTNNTTQPLSFNTFHVEIVLNVTERLGEFHLEIFYSTSPAVTSTVLISTRSFPITISASQVERHQHASQIVWKMKAFDPNHYLRFKISKLAGIRVSSANCINSGLYVYNGEDIEVSKLYGPFCINNFPLSHFTSSGSYLTIVYYFINGTNQGAVEFNVTEDTCKGVTLGENLSPEEITRPACYNMQYLSPVYTYMFDYLYTAHEITFKVMDSMSLLSVHVALTEMPCVEASGKKCFQYLLFRNAYHEVLCQRTTPCQDSSIPCLDIPSSSAGFGRLLLPGSEFSSLLRSSCTASPISVTAKLVFGDLAYLDSSNCRTYDNCAEQHVSNRIPCGLLVLSSPNCHYEIGMFDIMLTAKTQRYGFQHFILQVHRNGHYGSETDITITETIYSSFRHHFFYRQSSRDVLLRLLCDDQIEENFPQVYRYPTIASDSITIKMKSSQLISVEFQLVQLENPVRKSNSCQHLEDYHFFNGYCYRYYLHIHELKGKIGQDDIATWNDAERECKQSGGQLINILSEDEEQFVMDMLSTHWTRRAYGDGVYVAVFIGLKESGVEDLRWTDGNPLTYTKWYHPSRKSDTYTEAILNGYANDLLDVISPNDIQPVKDDASRCTVMIVKNPFIGGRWAKIPCDFPLSFASYICKVPEAKRFNVTEQAVEHVNDEIKKQVKLDHLNCPPKWTYYANKCYLLITSETDIDVPLTYHNASDLCSDYNGHLAFASDDNLVDATNMLQLWRHRPEYGTVLIEKSHDICQELVGSYPNSDFIHAENKLLLKCPEMTWKIHPTSCNDYFPYHWSSHNFNSFLTPINVLCERELDDITPSCSDVQFECADGSCIYNGWVCDGQKDCPKGEDEEQCENDCGSSYFRCKSGECVPISGYCDFVPHCSDASDETKCIYANCTSNEFRCGNGKCISLNITCNFVDDCANSADESEDQCNWADTCEKRGGFACYDDQCLPGSVKHNIIMDCKGKTQEDEKYNIQDYKKGEVSGSILGASIDVIKSPFCANAGALKSRCHTNQPACFDRHQACILDVDNQYKVKGCGDLAHLKKCENFTCPGYFKCANSYCIPLHRVCNDILDCPGGEDETHCQDFSCPGNFRCKGESWCLDQNKVCDGQIDCKQHQDDEIFCELGNLCPEACTCRGYTINCTHGGLVNLPNKSEYKRNIVFANNSLNLTEITFKTHYYVGYLDLSYNGIDVICPHAFADMYNLLVLILVGNSIRLLDNSPFYNLRLNYLDLRNNFIEHISVNAFKGLTRVDTMDLRNNYEYMIIDDSAFQDISLELLRTDAFRFCCLAPGNCTPEADEFSSCADLMSNYVLRVFIWILGIIACLGNMFVIVWRLKDDRKKVDSFFIIHLSISDCLMGVYLLIIAGADMHYTVQGQYYLYDPIWRQSAGCQIAGFLASLSSEMSVTMLLLITTDRFIVMVLTFDREPINMKQARIITVIGWLLWIIVCALPFTGIPYFGPVGNLYGRTAVCLPFTLSGLSTVGLEYTVSIFLVFNFLAFFVIAVLYAAIFHHSNKLRKSSGRKPDERDLTLAKRVALVVATDFFCWIPIIIASLMAMSGISILPEVSAWVAVFILPINSALNPILYTISGLKKSQILSRMGVKSQSNSTNLNKHSTKDRNRNISTATMITQL